MPFKTKTDFSTLSSAKVANFAKKSITSLPKKARISNFSNISRDKKANFGNFLTFHDAAEQAYQNELEGLSCFRLVQCMDGCKDYEGGFHFCRHVNMLMRKKTRQRGTEGYNLR